MQGWKIKESTPFTLFFLLPFPPVLHRIYPGVQAFVHKFDISDGVKSMGVKSADDLIHLLKVVAFDNRIDDRNFLDGSMSFMVGDPVAIGL